MPSERPWYKKKRFLVPLVLVFFAGVLVLLYSIDTYISSPPIADISPLRYRVTEPDRGFYACNGSWLQHSSSGLWEMYIHGSPFERGVVNGKLTHDLIATQEEAFIAQIRKMVPLTSYLKFLKYFIYWFNRDIDEYLTDEYKQQIYGISFSLSEKFNFIGRPYQRMLNYQSAHDIGHALQDFALVGCTSFGAWDSRTADSSLIIGRNFDFYMGDNFAKNKIVCFERPDSGYAFMMVTWPGMIGTVSGMNMRGLTVTINAAKSEIPWSARTPISLLAREILQYAANIKEAYDIALRRETFVSESILIGSAMDHKAAIIEKAPLRPILVLPHEDMIICSNHYQSDEFYNDPLNLQNIRESSSMYRFRRMQQLIGSAAPMDVSGAAAILRNRSGLNGTDIGMGNEKSINQLIAHHSVIFLPEKRLAWVSAGPWQEGSYICYDLNKIFNNFASLQQRAEIEEAALNIPSDSFLGTTGYLKFLQYKAMRDSIRHILQKKKPGELSRSFIDELTAMNPAFYEGYRLAGDLFEKNGDPETALRFYAEALKHEIPTLTEREEIIRKMSRCIVETKRDH
jgi:isopenicillin-N N-acyltransferase-like protein